MFLTHLLKPLKHDISINPKYIFLALFYYMCFPYFLFFIGWLNFFFATVFCGLLFIGLITATKTITNPEDLTILTAPLWKWMSYILLILAWTAASGSGKFGYQNYDYMKHNGIYHDLLTQLWPASIPWEGKQYYIVYYVAHYLFPSLMGKWGGIPALEWTAFLQTFLGLTLIITASLSFINFNFAKFMLFVLLSFIAWGGLDVVGQTIFPADFSKWSEFPEWWAGITTFQYSGFSDLLFWVPQHAIGGWGCTLLCLYACRNSQWLILPFFIALGLLWSPLICIGLIPFIFLYFGNIFAEKKYFKIFTSFYSYISLAFLILIYCFYSSQFYQQPFAWQLFRMGVPDFLLRYSVFCILEFLLILIPVFMYYKYWPKWMRQILIPMLLTLLILPHIYFGHYSDVAMRSSVPMLLLCFIFFWKSYGEFIQFKKWKYIFWVYLIIGSYSFLSDMHRGQRLKMQNLGYISVMNYDPKGISQQYLGLPDTLFFNFFCHKIDLENVKPLSPAPTF